MTPKPDGADDDTDVGQAVAASGVRNTVSRVVGGLVQAGVVRDGVHLHAAAQPPAPVVPRQLPAAPGLFAGRRAELARLDRALAAMSPDRRDTSGDRSDGAATVMVSAIGGAGGIGKTWLALAWAYRHLDRFPDGQLFVDLHGFSPTQPLAPGTAVRGFLDALGVDPGRIPADLEAQAALYRSLVAGKRMLIVLDNAATADQVVPLLPGSPSCTVLITGRHRLASLIDRYGAHHLTLDVLTRDEARTQLAARLGADRVAAEPESVDDLLELCGRYPLALSITARNAAIHPGISLAEIAAELRELGLEMLDHDTDPAASLSTVLSWSMRYLDDTQRTVFGLLGIAPGPDTTLPAVVSLTALPAPRVRRALSALDDMSLIERRPGSRYAMHDLVRDYATITARALPDDLREQALVRVADFHLHTARAADRLLTPHRQLVPFDSRTAGVRPIPLPDAAAAMAWLDAEHTTILATQRAAVALGHHAVVWHIAWALDTFHRRRGHRRDGLAAWRAALDAAAHLRDPAARSRAHLHVGRACARLGLLEEATRHLDQALDLAVRHRDPTGQAHTHRALAFTWGRRGDDRWALDHARRSLDLQRTLEQPTWEADALNAVGRFAARVGELDTAREHCDAARALHRQHHNPTGEATALDSLGSIAHRTGDYRQAIDHHRQALSLFRALSNTYRVADALDNLGHSHAALGQLDDARAVWREALALYREQGRDTDAQRLQQRLHNLGRLADRRPDGT